MSSSRISHFKTEALSDHRHERDVHDGTSATTATPVMQMKHSKWNSFFSSSPSLSSSSLKNEQTNPKLTPTLTTARTPSSSTRRRSRLLSSTSRNNADGWKHLLASPITTSTASTTTATNKSAGITSATITWTIDDALRSLYDENCTSGITNNATTSSLEDDPIHVRRLTDNYENDDESSYAWWNKDDESYYTIKKERNFLKRATIIPQHGNQEMDDVTALAQPHFDRDENDIEENNPADDHATTLQLFHELHNDPLISVLETIAQNEFLTNQYRTTITELEDVDNDEEFGDFQSAELDVTGDSELSTPIVQGASEAQDKTIEEKETPNSKKIHSHHQNEISATPRAISFDDEDNEELMQYVDSILLGSPKTTTTNSTNHTSSTLDTPDLVRIVDDIISVAAATTTKKAFAGSEDTSQENDQQDVEAVDVQDISSSHQQQIMKNIDKVEVSTPLSMQLPVGNDLSTLESRFIRRLQHRYYSGHELGSDASLVETLLNNESDTLTGTEQSTYPDLPAYYFTNPDLDDTVSVLQSMPWEYVLPSYTRGVGSFDHVGKNSVEENNEEAWAMWDEYVTSRLCHLDTALEDMQADTLEQIQPHKERIARTNTLIHEWDQNVRLSLMYCERSQQAVNALMGVDDEMIGLVGPSILLQLFEQRNDYRNFSLVVDQLNEIWERERDIMNRIDRFNVENFKALDEYFAVMKLAKELDICVSDTKLAQLHCLVTLRDRLKSIGMRFWVRLLDIARTIVVKTCRDTSSFDRHQYERVLRAMLDLKSQSIVDESVASVDLSTSWTDNILSAESYEVDRALASALLKPTDYEASSHATELKQFAYQLDLHWGDYAMLRGMMHNLVTLRFDFEWQMNYLPRVFHRLCKCLTDILISHNILVKWHRDSMCSQNPMALLQQSDKFFDSTTVKSDLKSIYDSMIARTTQLWEHCDGIVANCLDEYLNFAPKRPLFRRGTNGIDDVLWRDDLERLRNVYTLANTFLSVKKSFQELNKCTQTKADSTCLFSPKLVGIFKRHVRAVHVEAMNTLGRCLANESWILGSFVVSAEPERTDQPELSIEAILLRAMQAALRRSEPISKVVTNTICDLSCSYDARSFVARLDANENPFDSIASANLNRDGTNESHSPENDVELSEHSVYRALSSFIHENDGSIRLAPDAVSKELIAWFARLLMVLEKLPLIAEDVSNVFINLCDLYFTTVFRLCSGSVKNERLILGADYPIPMHCSIDDSKGIDKAIGAPLFGSFRNTPKKTGSSKNITTRQTISVNLDAEICFPRPRYRVEAHALKEFIDRAQNSLRDAVNLDMIDSWLVDPTADSPEEQGCEVARVLIKREGSISSCYTVAALIEVAQKVARQNQSSLLPPEFTIDRELSSLRLYSQSVLDIVPKLARVARQIACTRAVAGGSVVKDILRVDTGWEECKLHECSNDYIDDLSYRCALIWGYLAASNKLPLIIMRETWEGVVASSYLALLEGFSRIRQCSTEGRSLMALDLATFKAGLSPTNIADRLEGVVIVNKPPPINPEVNFFFVETYIKVFYYPSEDVLNWIKDNCDHYALNHCMGLAVAVYLSSQKPKSEEAFNSLLESIKALYPVDEKLGTLSIRQVEQN